MEIYGLNFGTKQDWSESAVPFDLVLSAPKLAILVPNRLSVLIGKSTFGS